MCRVIFFQCFYSQSLICLAQDSSEDWELGVSRFTQGQTLRTIFFVAVTKWRAPLVKPVLSDQGMNSNLAFPTFILSLLKNSTKYKNAFLSDQCRDIEENTRVWKTRDLFKKIRDAKVTFHAKMGSKKNRNGMDVTEAEDIKRWQE